jgi:anti-anti-sigma regulatory factor
MQSLTFRLPSQLTSIGLDEFRRNVPSAELRTQQVLILDCRDLTYIDTPALQAIAALRIEAQHRGATVLMQHVPDSVLSDAELVGMAGVLAEAPLTLAPL